MIIFFALYDLNFVELSFGHMIITVRTKLLFITFQVCRGTAVMLVSPTDGTDEIANPFLEADGA